MVKKLFATMAAICACALALVLPAVAFAAPADASPTVVYDGGDKAWHGEGLQQQDVLADFSGVLPGDTLVQEFDLEVRNVERAVSVFMCPHGDAATLAALADVEFLVADEQGNVIAQGTVGDFVDQAEAALSLGTFSAADSMHLRIELYAPTTLGNELQGKAYAFEWMFIAQEDGEEGSGSDGGGLGGAGQGGSSSATSGDLLSKTNDASAVIAAVFGIIGIAAVAAIVVAVARSRNRSCY